jgi:hypothetical protein
MENQCESLKELPPESDKKESGYENGCKDLKGFSFIANPGIESL